MLAVGQDREQVTGRCWVDPHGQEIVEDQEVVLGQPGEQVLVAIPSVRDDQPAGEVVQAQVGDGRAAVCTGGWKRQTG